MLLLEAGEGNDGLAHMVPGQRGTFWCSDAADKLNYRYKSVPEAELGGREIQIDRGRGLGGSTAINILGWDYSSREEMDEWARQVGDETWSWAKTREVFKHVRVQCSRLVWRNWTFTPWVCKTNPSLIGRNTAR